MLDQFRTLLRRGETAARDARAATELSRLGLPYLPWTASALRPAAMVQLVNEVLINQRRTVVELGAGLSTLYLAQVLAGTGGQLISFEDDAGWADIVRGQLAQLGLAGAARIIVAPLGASKHSQGGLEWYDEAAVSTALAGLTPDMVLIDGPPAFAPGKALARYPALPMVLPRLAKRCAVVLDDCDRAGERQVLAAWRTLPGFDFDVDMTDAGIAVLRRGGHYHTGM
jgi:predicted O-methyltransferase YrrM